MSNGSVALDLSLKLLKCNKEDEILLPSFNYIAAANAILNNYAVPHFIEINNQLTIDTVKLEHYLKKNTKIINRKCINITWNTIHCIDNRKCINIKTGRTISAVICLHTFGHSCDIDRLKKISKKFRLYLIEDAAESLGTYYKKIHTGTVGDVGILSFNGNKILTTGSGGALLLKKKKLADEAKRMINHYKKDHSWKFIHSSKGFNYKFSNINAALGLSQLKKFNICISFITPFFTPTISNNKMFLFITIPYNSNSMTT